MNIYESYPFPAEIIQHTLLAIPSLQS